MIIEQHNVHRISLDKLKLWEEANVRKENITEDIDDLANNIKENGLLSPLLVSGLTSEGKHLVFSGQRRLLACAKAGMDKIPCFVFDGISVHDARILSFSENLYRLSMDYKDKSNAALQLLHHLKKREKVAKVLGVGVQTVKKYLGYEALPEELKILVASKKMSAYTAVDIFSKFIDEEKVIKIAKEYASIPLKEKKKRQSFSSAMREAKSTETVEQIRQRAKKIEESVKYEILVPPQKSKTIEKVASVRLATREEIALEFLLERVDDYERGAD